MRGRAVPRAQPYRCGTDRTPKTRCGFASVLHDASSATEEDATKKGPGIALAILKTVLSFLLPQPLQFLPPRELAKQSSREQPL